MSIQIQIAQSSQDELDLVDFIQKYDQFWYHPRIFKAGSYSPKQFSPDLGLILQFFRRQDENLVKKQIVAVEDQWWDPQARQNGHDEEEQILPSNSLSIEWIRTERTTPQTCIAGRLYLNDHTPLSKAILADLTKSMHRLVTYIRTHYPRKSLDRHPYYVGPHLAHQIESGQMKLLYRGGKEMPLTENQ